MGVCGHRWLGLLLCALLSLCLLGVMASAHAGAPAAGVVIGIRATASYVPSGYTAQEVVSSNPVQVMVAAVEALTLTQDWSVNRPVGGAIVLSHVLTNTGNVNSTYTFNLVNLTGDNFNLSSLKLVQDVNGNGVVDANEPALPLGAASNITLARGQSINLLVVGYLPVSVTSGLSKLQLSVATNTATPLSAANTDTVTVTDKAVITLATAASERGYVLPGATVKYTLSATNIGVTDAVGTGSAAPLATAILIDGAPASVVLVRNTIAVGSSYVPGSLNSASAGSVRLFRLPGDPPFSYRTGADDAAAIEVAIGLTQKLPRNASMAMSFSATVKSGYTGVLSSSSDIFYNDGASSVETSANKVPLQVSEPRPGIAELAGVPQLGKTSAGVNDGTASVTLTFHIKNYSAQPIYDVAATDLLAGAAGFGSYVSSAVPGVGQYTVVANSLTVSQLSLGTIAVPATGYTGVAGAANLLANGSYIPPDGSAVVSLVVRYYTANRSGTIANTATVSAAASSGGTQGTVDDSISGEDPDPDGDEDPRNNTSITTIRAGVPQITLTQSASAPTLVAGTTDTYTFSYHLLVTNTGNTPIDNIRVVDNLNCTFQMDQSNGPVLSWELTGPVTMGKGLLMTGSPGYTGNVPCDRTKFVSADPMVGIPTEMQLNTTDGSRGLGVGQSEEIVIPVKIVRNRAYLTHVVRLSNKAYAGVFDRNSINGAIVEAAASDAAITLLADPAGVVYNANDRTPVAGAVVSLARNSCQTGSATPITPAEIFNGTVPGAFTFDANGAVSMTTGADGFYQFLLNMPPVVDVCDYTLSVATPTGSGLTFPSTVIPATAGNAPAGAPQAQGTAPSATQDTTYYLNFRLGPNQGDVWNNHIPVDVAAGGGLLLKKVGNKTTVEVADFVAYALQISNQSGVKLTGYSFVDTLPAGFAYVPGSARLVGPSNVAQVLADPAGGVGPVLTFSLPGEVLAAGEQATLRYRVRVGVGASLGYGINRAKAYSGTRVSNEAVYRVTVTGGVFANEGLLFGKVYLDCNNSGTQDHEEVGIPGVRMLIEDGTSVVTDVEGKWSLYGLKPLTHVLKLDQNTLPPGAVLKVLDNRNSGRGDSRFVDLKNGEMHKADFAVNSCTGTAGDAVVQAVHERRKSLAAQADSEGEMSPKRKLDAVGKIIAPADLKALPASGVVGGASAAAPTTPSTTPEVFRSALPQVLSSPGSGAASVSAPQPVVDLESLIADLNNDAGFIDLKDHDTLPLASLNVRVKGMQGATLRLKVNGEVESEKRVGKKSEVPVHQLAAWEYIGVTLHPGENKLLLEEVDPFGAVRHSQEITLVAPGQLGSIEIEAPESSPADPGAPVQIKVRLTDDHGVPVTVRTQLTLESKLGRWERTDLNPNETGTQVFIEGGSDVYLLVPPNDPGTSVLRVSAGTLEKEVKIDFLPRMQPMVGAGIVEGVIDLRSLGRTALNAPTAKDAFEAELTAFSRESNDGRHSATARTAFYFKGTIKGEYLLTTAYDSDKAANMRLFRDIQPEEFYPVYGDSAVKSFDAQSTGRLYVRIDKDKSYLLYGDFNTASTPEVRQLTQFSHSLSGLQQHYENKNVSATGFFSRDTLKQFVEDFPANGTSGPFILSGSGDFYANSEIVELVVRDRRQNGTVVSVTPLTRFTDYTVEPVTKRLLFKGPVAMQDENFNPRYIRVTYQINAGGAPFVVAGADVQLKLADNVQVGVVYGRDGDPAKDATLSGVTAVVKLGEKSALTAEVARTDTLASGSGNGRRIEIKSDDADLKLRAQITQTSAGFDNPGAYSTKGHNDAIGTATYKLTDKTRLTAEVLSTTDTVTGDSNRGVLLGVGATLADGVQAEVGARVARQTASATGASTDLHTLRGQLAAQVPGVPQAKVVAEYEQDVSESSKRMLAVGGNYQLAEKTRLFGRYEAISSLGNPFGLATTQQNNVASLGIESGYMEGGSTFNEYRLRDTITGRESQLANGVRNQWKLGEGLSLSTSVERTAALGGVAGQRSVAATAGLDWTVNPRMKASGSLELRNADSSESVLNTLGVSYKVDESWSMLARSTVQATRNKGTSVGNALLMRQQLGAAYRPVDSDVWNALLRYEHKLEDSTGADALGNTDLGNTESHIIAAHLNYQPQSKVTASGRYALKYSTLAADGLSSGTWAQLLYGRLMMDIAPRWDVGVQTALLLGQGGTVKRSLGLEAGYQLVDNLWLSFGYNIFGLTEPELAGADYLDRGVYVRMRFKFDENLFK